MKKHFAAIILSIIVIIPMLFFSQTALIQTAAKVPFENKTKAVLLNVQTDFGFDTKESEYIAMLDRLGAIGFNTVIINTDNGTDRFYGTNINTLSDDICPVDLMVAYAKKCGFKVYLIVDFALALKECDCLFNAGDFAAHTISGIASRYAPDAVIFKNIYIQPSAVYYSEYLSYGGGMGFDFYLNEASRKAANCAFYELENGNLQIGLDRITQNTQNNTDIDLDFDLILKNPGDTYSSDTASLYLCCNAVLQQNGPQSVVEALSLISQYDNCVGTALSSYRALADNENINTETIKRYFSNNLDMTVLGNELSVSTPTSQAFSTKESSVIFSGTCDPNFALTINGETVDCDKSGAFSVQKSLQVGQNIFDVANGNTTKTYTVTRNVNIFNASSLTPSTDVTVGGANTLNVSIYAYPGASVTATFNSVTLTMQQTDTADSMGYKLYQCTFTMPPAASYEQNLGRISISGTFSGISESISGASVRVGAQSSQSVKYNANSDNIATGDIIPAVAGNAVTNPSGSANGSVIKITTDNASVYPEYSTKRIPVPTQMKLAADTIDFISKTVNCDGVDCYITKSGRRIKTEDAVLLSESTISQNTVSAECCYMSGNDTVIKLKQDYKTPYCILYSPISFAKNPYGDWGDYFLSDFSPNTITIVFDYCTNALGGFDFPDNSLFSACSWRLVDINGTQKAALDLTLAKNGVYSGVTVGYDSQGCIVFSFNGAETAVSDMVIVIDPGHGYISSGEYDPGALGKFSSKGLYCEEASANLGVSIYLEEKLKEMGATVIRLQTESTPYPTNGRSDIARQYDPDLYISLHCNGSTSSAAQGSSTYYFQPFSYPLAKAVEASLASFYTQSVHGVNKSEGARFDYFYVTTQPDFPSILVEMGYITNYTEAAVLTNPDYQKQIAQAIAEGISNYAQSLK